jgi:hypothetical protein
MGIIVSIVALLLSSTAAYAQTPQVERIRFTEYGIYTVDRDVQGRDVLGINRAAATNVRHAATLRTIIVPLPIVAILSNVLFALYGLSAHLYPVFLLHSILLPINVFKLTHLELLPRMAGLWSATASGRPPIQKQSR